jgi:hypothetical protein
MAASYHIGGGPHDGADHELAATAASLTIEVLREALDVYEYGSGEGDNFHAELRRLHAAGEAIQKRKAEHDFKIVHEIRRAGLCQTDRISARETQQIQ